MAEKAKRRTLDYRAVPMPDHPLLGRVVSVCAVEFAYDSADAALHLEPLSPHSLLLTYDDGREILIDPAGYETDGLTIDLYGAARVVKEF